MYGVKRPFYSEVNRKTERNKQSGIQSASLSRAHVHTKTERHEYERILPLRCTTRRKAFLLVHHLAVLALLMEAQPSNPTALGELERMA